MAVLMPKPIRTKPTSRAASVEDSLVAEMREWIGEARNELATRANMADIRNEIVEGKTDIIKWNLASIIAVVGAMLAMSKVFGG